MNYQQEDLGVSSDLEIIDQILGVQASFLALQQITDSVVHLTARFQPFA